MPTTDYIFTGLQPFWNFDSFSIAPRRFGGGIGFINTAGGIITYDPEGGEKYSFTDDFNFMFQVSDIALKFHNNSPFVNRFWNSTEGDQPDYINSHYGLFGKWWTSNYEHCLIEDTGNNKVTEIGASKHRSMDVYSYANSNPANNSDPTGLWTGPGGIGGGVRGCFRKPSDLSPIGGYLDLGHVYGFGYMDCDSLCGIHPTTGKLALCSFWGVGEIYHYMYENGNWIKKATYDIYDFGLSSPCEVDLWSHLSDYSEPGIVTLYGELCCHILDHCPTQDHTCTMFDIIDEFHYMFVALDNIITVKELSGIPPCVCYDWHNPNWWESVFLGEPSASWQFTLNEIKKMWGGANPMISNAPCGCIDWQNSVDQQLFSKAGVLRGKPLSCWKKREVNLVTLLFVFQHHWNEIVPKEIDSAIYAIDVWLFGNKIFPASEMDAMFSPWGEISKTGWTI